MLKILRNFFGGADSKIGDSSDGNKKIMEDIASLKNTMEKLRNTLMGRKNTESLEAIKEVEAIQQVIANLEDNGRIGDLARTIFRRADALIGKVSPLIKLPNAPDTQTGTKEFQIKLISLLTEIGLVVVRNYTEEDLNQALETIKS